MQQPPNKMSQRLFKTRTCSKWVAGRRATRSPQPAARVARRRARTHRASWARAGRPPAAAARPAAGPARTETSFASTGEPNTAASILSLVLRTNLSF